MGNPIQQKTKGASKNGQDTTNARQDHIRDSMSDEESDHILDSLYADASMVKDSFENNVKTIAASANGEPKLAPGLKLKSRAQEKIKNDYKNNSLRITDLLRATILFDNKAQTEEGRKQIKNPLKVVDEKNRFQPDNLSYADMNLKVMVESPDQNIEHVAELQLRTHAMNKANEHGHKIYEMYRKLQDNEQNKEEIARLMKLERDIYAPAWAILNSKEGGKLSDEQVKKMEAIVQEEQKNQENRKNVSG